MKALKTATIYARISSDEHIRNDDGLGKQESLCRRLCDAQGKTVEATISDSTTTAQAQHATKDNVPLPGRVKCSKCGKSLVGCRALGGRKIYSYYCCTNPECRAAPLARY